MQPEPTYAPVLARYAAVLAAQRRYHQLGLAIRRAAQRHDIDAVRRLAEQARVAQAAWQQLVRGEGA